MRLENIVHTPWSIRNPRRESKLYELREELLSLLPLLACNEARAIEAALYGETMTDYAAGRGICADTARSHKHRGILHLRLLIAGEPLPKPKPKTKATGYAAKPRISSLYW